MKPVLAECPFCGGEANEPTLLPGDGWTVWCNACGAQGPSIQGDPGAAKREAARLWNKREFNVNQCEGCPSIDGG
jgi:Lar family restriction alleviation protein